MTMLSQPVIYRERAGAPVRAAIVARELPDGLVNLTVFGAGGESQPERRVPFVPEPIDGECCWAARP